MGTEPNERDLDSFLNNVQSSLVINRTKPSQPSVVSMKVVADINIHANCTFQPKFV